MALFLGNLCLTEKVFFLFQSYLFSQVFDGITLLTNLGGALLAILASGNSNKKESIRYIIAHYYLAFTGIQLLLIIVLTKNYEIIISNFFTPIVAAAVYFLIGQRIFTLTSPLVYNKLLTILLAIYGCIILINIRP